MRKTINLICLFIIFLAGCRGNDVAMNAPSFPTLTQVITPSPPTATSFPTPTPSATPSLPQTLLPAEIGTPTFTATPIIYPEAHLQLRCIDVAPELPDDVNTTGIIVLKGQIIKGDDSYYAPGTLLLDLATGNYTEAAEPCEFQTLYTVSPDRKHLAYLSVLEDGDKYLKNLVITLADRQQLKTIPWDEERWSTLVGWLNNDQLIIKLLNLNPETGDGPADLLAINPFNEEQQVLKPDFPGFYFEAIQSWSGWSGRVYNPTFTRVAYTQRSEDGHPALALWDTEKQQVLNYLTPYWFAVPQWSPDGLQLVVSAPVGDNEELFLMDREGLVKQLTNLNAYTNVRWITYGWDPTGRYIAAWISTDLLKQQNQAELIIVDTDTREVIDTCVQVRHGGGLKEGYTPVPARPIWSPNGKQIIVYDWYERNHKRVILVDWMQSFAAQIAQDMEPRGWMLAP